VNRFCVGTLVQQQACLACCFVLLLSGLSGVLPVQTAQAERYESRLNQLILKKTELYLPSRLFIGEEAHFVVKAPAGSMVRLYVSPEGEGAILSNGRPIRVGKESAVISGVVPDTGVLDLKFAVPNANEMAGKGLYVDAVAGASEEDLVPLDIIDATGRKATANYLNLAQHAKANTLPVMPYMEGMSPQAFSQMTTLGDIYAKNDTARKQLLDNGDIDPTRATDRNPFTQRGGVKGLGF